MTENVSIKTGGSNNHEAEIPGFERREKAYMEPPPRTTD